MEPRTVLLVKSREVGWAAVDAALRPMAGVRVIGEATSAARAIDLAATLRPDAILSATVVDGTVMRPLLAALRPAPCPPPIVVLFGQRPDADDVRHGHDLVVSAHLLWSDLSADTLGHVLAAVLSGEVIVASRPVYEAFVRTRPYLEPPPGQEAGPTLTSRERAVLRGPADGLTRKAIAADSGLSPRTVARIVDDLEAKLGATSACALVAKSVALGLLARPGGSRGGMILEQSCGSGILG